MNHRRKFIRDAAALWMTTTPLVTLAVNQPRDEEPSSSLRSENMTLQRELVRYATMAPSSHNAQCWKFKLEPQSITILADLARRCPAVDPNDHHLFVSLGCATENLIHAASAKGLCAQVGFDAAGEGTVRIALDPGPATRSPWFDAIAQRQCARVA